MDEMKKKEPKEKGGTDFDKQDALRSTSEIFVVIYVAML